MPNSWINFYRDTNFGLCLLQRLSSRLVAAHLCRSLDPRPRSETPHIVSASILFGFLVRFPRGRTCLAVAIPPRCAILGTSAVGPGNSRPDESTAPRSATVNSVMNLRRS